MDADTPMGIRRVAAKRGGQEARRGKMPENRWKLVSEAIGEKF